MTKNFESNRFGLDRISKFRIGLDRKRKNFESNRFGPDRKRKNFESNRIGLDRISKFFESNRIRPIRFEIRPNRFDSIRFENQVYYILSILRASSKNKAFYRKKERDQFSIF